MFELVDLLKNSILICLWMEFIWQAYLNRRQFDKVHHTRELPREIRNIMPPPIFRVSRQYALANLDFYLAKNTVAVVFSYMMISNDYMARLWVYANNKDPFGSEIFTGCIWLAILCALSSLVDFTFDIYHNFILERSLEMPILSFKQMLKESFINFLIIEVLSTAIAAIIVAIIQFTGRYLFVILWGVCCVLLLIFTHLAHLIGYLRTLGLVEFPDIDLKQKIENFCRELNFPLERIELLVQSTSMDEHKLIYYYGMFRKVLVISVNILPITGIEETLNEEEILALITHQLGHWHKKHDIKKFLILEAALLIWFSCFIFAFERNIVYEAFGFHDSKPVLAGILITIQYVMMPYNVLMTFILMYWSRSYEYEADVFAVQLGMKNSLKRALIKIYVVNFQFPVLDYLYSKHNFHYPSLLERIKHLNQSSSLTSTI